MTSPDLPSGESPSQELVEALDEVEYWRERAEDSEAQYEDAVSRIISMEEAQQAQRRALTARLADLIASIQ